MTNDTEFIEPIHIGDLVLCNFKTPALVNSDIYGQHYGIVLQVNRSPKPLNSVYVIATRGTFMYLSRKHFKLIAQRNADNERH